MEVQYDDSLVTLKDGTIQVDGIKVAGSITFRRDPRLGHLVRESSGASRPERTHIVVIPLDESGLPMRFCSGGHYAPRSHFTKRTRNLYHGVRDGLDDLCGSCRRIQLRRHRQLGRTAG